MVTLAGCTGAMGCCDAYIVRVDVEDSVTDWQVVHVDLHYKMRPRTRNFAVRALKVGRVLCIESVVVVGWFV